MTKARIGLICFATLFGCLTFFGTLGTNALQSAEVFELAVLGDQQRTVDPVFSPTLDYYDLFTDATDWIASNAVAENIRFVVQVGDIVEHGIDTGEYDLATNAMAMLDSAPNADGGTGIPWAVSYGNHEMIIPPGTSNPRTTLDPQDVARSQNYRDYFATNETPGTPHTTVGLHRYEGDSGYGGVSANDLNTWHVFRDSAAPDAKEYLVLNLEFDVPGGSDPTVPGTPDFDTIAWAQDVIDAHPNKPTIIQTHIFEGDQFGPPNAAYYTGGPGRNSQLSIFDKLVEDNSQVFMVLSGHTHQGTHQFKTNAEGLQVIQLVTDFSKSNDATAGVAGGGYFRRLEFDEDSQEIRVKTYSATADQDGNPSTPAFMTDATNQFTWSLNWDARFEDAFPRSDLNFDTFVDDVDWLIFVAYLETDLSSLPLGEAYAKGDVNYDGFNDDKDLELFINDFETANGSGAFTAMLHEAPEPHGILLVSSLLSVLSTLHRTLRRKSR